MISVPVSIKCVAGFAAFSVRNAELVTVGEFGVEPREVDDEGGVGMNRSLREIAKGEELNEFLA